MNALVVDDHPLIRTAVRRLLNDEFGDAFLDEAGDLGTANTKVRAIKWDLIVLDLHFPNGNGLDFLARIKAICPQAKVLILTCFPELQYAIPAIRSGASGYLSKDRTGEEFGQAVREIMRGHYYLSTEMLIECASSIASGDSRKQHYKLSTREFQIMLHLAAGHSLRAIAEKVHLSESTIGTYRKRILTKMRCQSNADLTDYCFMEGLWLGKQ